VINVLKSWIENYCQDDEEDRTVLSKLESFAQSTMSSIKENNIPPNAVPQILNLINKRRQGLLFRKLVLTRSECPAPITPKNLKRIKYVLDIDPLEVARQLTLMESRDYNKIQPVEFLKKAWSERDSNVAINVKQMILMSNQVTGWVAQCILSEKDIKRRSALIKHFILVADRCRALNNFNTLMAILAGLNSAPIHRLKRTWELLSTRAQSILDILRKTMNPTKNFSTYRESLHSVNPPCVPFLGFYLTDLTFIEDGNPNFLKSNARHINFSKRMKTAEVIREIQQYQNAPYSLRDVAEIQEFLRGCLRESADETDLYNMSLQLEPRER
ncbi:hypothetical protein HK102_012227, partial [Quaeritorhiza haematococci]